MPSSSKSMAGMTISNTPLKPPSPPIAPREPNAQGEIETLEEFVLEVEDAFKTLDTANANSNKKKVEADQVQEINFHGWTFTDIDFTKSPFSAQEWKQFNFKGATLFGCVLPSFLSSSALENAGASVLAQPMDVPFKAYRAFMYRQQELIEKDSEIYKFYLTKGDLRSRLLQSSHDNFMEDALSDYLEGKTVVAIMGGHAMKRMDAQYAKVVVMAWKLARNGYVVASGGGPGAMEASNLGAYLFEHSIEQVDEAIKLLGSTCDPSVENEYQDRWGPQAVINMFGWPTYQPSLAIPTWKYGHEPSNMFSTWVAKFFSNAIREDGLLEVANGGIIYTPGSAGTRQEVFQASCGNHYAPPGKEKPTIFFGTKFWADSGVPEVLKRASTDKPFANWIVETDSVDEVVHCIERFRAEMDLPTVSIKQLKSKHWLAPKLRTQSSANLLVTEEERSQEKVSGNRSIKHRHSADEIEFTKARQVSPKSRSRVSISTKFSTALSIARKKRIEKRKAREERKKLMRELPTDCLDCE